MTPARSDHFNGKTFFQPHHAQMRLRDFWWWRLTHRSAPWPAHVPFVAQPPPPAARGDDIVATWLGHASFLLQTRQGNLLIDPVYSERVSPLTWAGPRRVHPVGVAFEALPRIDAVLVSHDHYDHCDTATLRRLEAAHHPQFVTPLRHADLLGVAGVPAERMAELDWWETATLPSGLRVTLTPAKHWSNRFGSPRNHRLWGGFYLRMGAAVRSDAGAAPPPGPDAIPQREKRVWFAGDTGYDPETIRTVRMRFGAPDLALVPIGAYEPRWFMAPMHMDPTEAVQLHRDAGARLSVGMHWGTFHLTDEGHDVPPAALARAREAAGVAAETFRAVAPGESVVV